MHDDRELVEERITRELTERVLPLVHPERRPLAVEAGPTLDDLAPFAVGGRWGPPWGTTWFRFTGEVPAAWSGRRVEALLDLGFAADSPGFQCEGLVRDAKGRPVQGIHPRRQARRRRRRAGAGRARRRGGVEPDAPAVPPVAARLARHGGHARRCTASSGPSSCASTPTPRRCCTTSTSSTRVMRTLPLDDPRRARIRVAIVAGARRAGAAARRMRRRGGRGARRGRAGARRCPPAPAPTASSRPVTPTSTRRGCGRCARPCASARARSPRRSP